ncbi:MAG: LD-carboxypeptidase [Anaerovoracaceae bacterium]
MKKPKLLQKGDTIGIISPSSPSETRSEVPRGIETLEAKGYKTILGKNVNKTKGFVAASEEDRAEDFNQMFRNDNVDAVFVTQGGYGTAQLMKLIDFDLVARNPKIFTGFSDITSLHLMINKFADVVSFHGPGMARFNKEDLTAYTEEYFFKAIANKQPIGNIPLADHKKWLQVVSPGVAEGKIIGGNITLICASLGTPYEIDTKGKILFLEDVDQEPWIMDHCFSHLRNAGKFDDIKGIIIGECFNCKPFDYKPGYCCDTSIEDVFDYYFGRLNVPVLYGLPLGHTNDLATLPLGVEVRLSCDDKTLTILESGVE